MSNTVTLKKGTWFHFNNQGETKLGEIVDYQRDDERADLHWFKCHLHYNSNERCSMDEEKVYSSRNFEQFSSLDLFEEEEGRQILNSLIERDQGREAPRQNARTISDMIEAAAREAQMTPGARPLDNSDNSDDTDAEQTDREYQPRSIFRPMNDLPDIESKKFQTTLGSGDMKSVLKLYEANPERSWNTVDTIINETGHLLLSWTKSDLRQKIINQKINYLTKHNWMDLEINSMYELQYQDNITIGIYLGDQHWAMHPTRKNEISELVGKTYIMIKENINDFYIRLIDKRENQDIHDRIIRVMEEISPSEIRSLSEGGNNSVYCRSDSDNVEIARRDVSKNWEKAFVYNYYTGGDMDTRLKLDQFNSSDKKAITRLAEVRKDTEVLEAMV